MGILHKLILILQKVDPENTLWYKLQREKVLKELEEVLNHEDKKEREELLDEINNTFDTKINYPDYARKLFLIENCIYGVDIQPIAIQIAKLRFFISLIIDQNVDKTKENFGIRPLPNLETKFVCANTLIGLDKPNGALISPQVVKLEEAIKNLRHRYFQAKTRSQKLNLQKKDRELREKLAKELEKGGFSTESSNKIANFDLYDQNASSDWFDPEWLFGVIDGFDIVIGNPPYIQLQKDEGALANLYQSKGYETFERTGDIYTLFYEKGIMLLKEGGHLCLITSNKWMRAGYGKKLRNFFIKYNPKILIDLGPNIFESATVDTNILLLQKKKIEKQQLKAVTLKKEENISIKDQLENKGVLLEKLTNDAWFIGSSAEQRLKEKIERNGKPLREWDVKIFYGIKTGLNTAFIITTEKRNEILANCKDEDERKRTEAIIKPILRGRDIKRYYYEWAGLWVILAKFGFYKESHLYPSIVNHLKKFEKSLKERGQCRYTRTGKNKSNDYSGQHHWLELDNNPQDYYLSEFEKEKVVYSEIVRQPQFYFDTENFYVEATSFLMTGKNTKYICALLNSNPVTYFFKKWYAGGGLGEEGYRYKKAFIENLPLPPITQSNQPIVSKIESLVENILTLKKQNPQEDTTHLEKEIDHLVYNLYNLTEEEIRIIEKDTE
jgi:hypothetical protein